eukprot:GFYU01001336.1.p1 GENE.GFYU01001336.1~~GFYU01001336.1.p1  ORF type:complete len:472 (-),score=165.80 GFYU01001336.1:1206-2582(-)
MSSKPSDKDKSAPKAKNGEDEEVFYEFGGAIGTTFIIISSHLMMYYFFVCLTYNKGLPMAPEDMDDIIPWVQRMWDIVVATASPTWYAVGMYSAFLVFETVLAFTMPGLKIKGLNIPSEGGRQLDYLCNGAAAWYVTLATVAYLHFNNIFRLTEIVDNLGPLTTVAVIAGNVVSVVIYVLGIALGKSIRMTGNHLYDFFMGSWLNPRFFGLDLKMWAEIRVSWILLWLLTASCVAKQYELYGVVSTPLWFMFIAHSLYVNACMKGEDCIPTTWDIFYEKWGWMLIYWNLAGVPFVYCYQSIYLLFSGPPFEHSTAYTVFCFTLLLSGYYIWDTANSQKNRFRMKLKGNYIPRLAPPQLPWGTLDNPKYLKTEAGSLLLIDGWWAHARKIHYTADLMMATSWGLICGQRSFIPYFYAFFFLTHLTHRVTRDMERCAKKYGKDWVKYTRKVPYIFIPGIF